MRDRIFYPAALILAGLMVFLALRPAMGALPSGPVSVGDGQYGEVRVSGVQLNRMLAGGDADIELLEDDGTHVLILEAEAGALVDDPVLGPHFQLAADLEAQFAGFEMTIAVTARPGEVRGASQMQVNYSAGRDGESGWQVFDLVPSDQTYSFTYRVPVKSGENGLDYLAIRPVVPDKSRTLIVSEIVFTRGQRWAPWPGE